MCGITVYFSSFRMMGDWAIIRSRLFPCSVRKGWVSTVGSYTVIFRFRSRVRVTGSSPSTLSPQRMSHSVPSSNCSTRTRNHHGGLGPGTRCASGRPGRARSPPRPHRPPLRQSRWSIGAAAPAAPLCSPGGVSARCVRGCPKARPRGSRCGAMLPATPGCRPAWTMQGGPSSCAQWNGRQPLGLRA